MANVSTVRIIDKRIEPQPDPVYAVSISPKQNQFYKIPCTGLSDSYLTFNNLTTLGTDRAYLDTFELEITAEFSFTFTSGKIGPDYEQWVFDSFPFNKCCEEVRVNINGGAFFSQPLSYLRAKERYWDERKISDSYGNVCPCHKPYLQNEMGVLAKTGYDWTIRELRHQATAMELAGLPSRLGETTKGFCPTSGGAVTSHNNSIVEEYDLGNQVTFKVKWREPIFASPFSSRIDATYGRPLYNITSMDLAFNMQDLKNMIRIADLDLVSYSVHLTDVQLCYQVCTIPPGFTPPSTTVVPYRRFVPYVTDDPHGQNLGSNDTNEKVTLTSGVYTLNEIPTAIWVFAGPSKNLLQQCPADGFTIHGVDTTNTYSHNRLFGFMKNISISCANTTQILNTATPYDLYRIAKANGCQDNFSDWSRVVPYRQFQPHDEHDDPIGHMMPFCAGPGSVLRLIPGTDIVLPEQELIPGANANNMVLQVEATFDIPRCNANFKNYSLWLLFEYVGVAAISPGQCQITMNPLGNGGAMRSAPVISSTPTEPVSTTEGSGWLDTVKNLWNKGKAFAKKTGLISKALNYIPTIGPGLSTAAKALGYGNTGMKRKRDDDDLYDDDVEGGAIMGMGDFV